jgi:nucleoside permease NupC
LFATSFCLDLSLTGNFKSMAVDLDTNYLDFVVGNLAAFSNGGFRFVFGLLYDKLKFRRIFNFMLLTNIFIASTFNLIRDN